MKTVFFMIMSDLYYFKQRGYMAINSFRRFHPKEDLFVFREDLFEKAIIAKKGLIKNELSNTTYLDLSKITFYFTDILYKKGYERVIFIQADVIITGRLDEVLKEDWEIGACMNYNKYENASIENVTKKMYLMNSIFGATKQYFWKRLEELIVSTNIKKYKHGDSDILNLMIYNDPKIKKMKLKIFDKKKDFYSCKSLNREGEMYVEDNQLMLDGEYVKAYHHGKGNVPKLRFEEMGFRQHVVEWLYDIGTTGQSYLAKGI